MKRYHTKSGSIYEVKGMSIRRATGGDHYKGRIAGGDWHEVTGISGGDVGQSLIIGHPDRPGLTITSPVTKIEDVAEA